MADSYSCNINIDPDATGNMYYRGTWQFCSEYKTGDVVEHNGYIFLCRKPHAGKDPIETGSNEYWLVLSGGQPQSETTTFKTLDGGYASTSEPNSYEQTTQATAIDGGSSSGRRYMPLV